MEQRSVATRVGAIGCLRSPRPDPPKQNGIVKSLPAPRRRGLERVAGPLTQTVTAPSLKAARQVLPGIIGSVSQCRLNGVFSDRS
jgi:hypothetical protein